MRSAPRDFVVTGLGAVCAVGRDRRELAEAVQRGLDGIARIGRFCTQDYLVHTGAEVKDPAGPGPDCLSAWDLAFRFAAQAAGEAAEHAAARDVARERIGLVLGTGLGDLEHAVHELSEAVAEYLGVRGPVLSVSTACSSSTSAIGLARDMLACGAADLVLAGGADVLTPEVFAGFHALGVLTPGKCAPYSHPFGTTLGEGAGFLALEGRASARARGVETLATLSGYGLSADGYHETSPEPSGAGVRRAAAAALSDAALAPGDVGYVNAHGSGTEANDPSEWRGISGLIGRETGLPVSSSKGALGHAQGAAGALEAIVTILTMGRGQVAPTLNWAGPRRFAPPDPVPGPHPRAFQYRHALCLNSAFGGANAALVISRSEPGRTTDRARTPVRILGMGVVGPWGLDLDRAPAEPQRIMGRVAPFPLDAVDPKLDPRGLDPMSRFLTAAASLSLKDAGVVVRGALRERTGLVTGAVRPSPASLAAFRDSIERGGLRHLSATAFARIVLNAPAGACSKLLSLRGPLTVLSVGAGSGLAAVLCAAELLSTREEPELMLAAGVDEAEPFAEEEGRPPGEGAACLVLGRSTRSDERPGVGIAGWALAGPGRLDEAMARAWAQSGWDVDVGAVWDEGSFAGSGAGALPSALACVMAAASILRGETERAWVTSDRGRSASLALLLTA